MLGSPPLTREPLFPLRLQPCQPRITPAHAGTTPSHDLTFFPAGDHPRSRGNHFIFQHPDELRIRITPAHAGTTPLLTASSPEVRDHPRSRGNHWHRQMYLARRIGSPPLTREPPKATKASGKKMGITPAHAGTTNGMQNLPEPIRDHPRSRGNHVRKFIENWHEWGSPPLTREPLCLGVASPADVGITPAHAGTTMIVPYNFKNIEDHPRSRGNHPLSDRLVPIPEGSPPLTREPPINCSGICARSGITPAHAGTTFSVPNMKELSWDHPRSRGNHKEIKCPLIGIAGSPPLTREPPPGIKAY